MKDYGEIRNIQNKLNKDLEYAYDRGYEKGFRDAYQNDGKPIGVPLSINYNLKNIRCHSSEIMNAFSEVLNSDFVLENLSNEVSNSDEVVTVVFRRTRPMAYGSNIGVTYPNYNPHIITVGTYDNPPHSNLTYNTCNTTTYMSYDTSPIRLYNDGKGGN